MVYNTIKKIISNENIKVISFDIFDTLVERPSIYPSDIFYLLNNKSKNIIKGNFYDIRKSIEEEAVKNKYDVNISIYEIYDYIAEKYKLSEEEKNTLIDLEINLELNLIQARKKIKDIYDFALSKNKKIICASDMYLTIDVIKNILVKNGYLNIDKIYISCEEKKRKDDGTLFKLILEKENISPYEILHIGDNEVSDVEIPLKYGILSFHIPRSVDEFFNSKETKKYANMYKYYNSYHPTERLLLGFIINKIINNKDKIKKENMIFATKYDIGYYVLGPFLFSLSSYIMNNKEIQNNYPYINFASRDGYLPMLAYNTLTKNDSSKYLKSKYIYAGRRAYNVANYNNNILEYILIEKPNIKHDYYTIKDLFRSLVSEDFIELIEKDSFDLDTLYSNDYSNDCLIIKKIISKYYKNIEDILINKKLNAKKYYNSSLDFNNGRAIIFDMGYSGSISKSISRLTKKKIDKIYVWESEKNKLLDIKNKTKTYSFYKKILLKYSNIFLEELCSPLEPSVIDFEYNKNDNFTAIFDGKEKFSSDMKIDMQLIHGASLDFIKDIDNIFGPYIDTFETITDNFTIKPINYLKNDKLDHSIINLKNIIFYDKMCRSDNLSLYDKLISIKNEFYKSKFLDKHIIVSNGNMDKNISNLKVAIHIHLFYADILYEIIDYLYDSPIYFDLLISVCNKENKDICLSLLNKTLLPKLKNIIIKIVPNRGRDIAPWIISFKKEQKNYDYICHIHTKKSNHFSWGNKWRKYLFRNLISPYSIKNILNIFTKNNKIGLIFPPIFPKLYKFMLLKDISFLGVNNEIVIINKLLKKMSIIGISKKKLLFSAGTMMWYKPASLTPLFDLNLSYKDFSEEPIKIGGDLAHAIERIPVIVADSLGYRSLCYINNKDILNYYIYNNYINNNFLFIKNKNNNLKQQIEEYRLKISWFNIFGICNNNKFLKIIFFGIKISIKMTTEKINKISYFIPVKKWRLAFKNRFNTRQ